jgi:hypothetical protein
MSNPTSTSFAFALSKLQNDRPLGNYQLGDDDPVLQITEMLDRIEQIKEAIPAAVSQSLDLSTTKLSTQFSLVTQPILESLAADQAHLGAIQQKLSSLEKRFINSGHVSSAPNQNLPSWLLIGISSLTLLLLGYNTYMSKEANWMLTPAGQAAKEIIEKNPKLTDNCRQLSASEQKKLGDQIKSKKICSIFL